MSDMDALTGLVEMIDLSPDRNFRRWCCPVAVLFEVLTSPQHGLSSDKMAPNHLGLCCNAIPGHQTPLITSGCVRPSGGGLPAGR